MDTKKKIVEADYWVFFPDRWFKDDRGFRKYMRWLKVHDEIVCYSPYPLNRWGAIRVHQIYGS